VRQGTDGVYSWVSGGTGPVNMHYRAVGSATWIDVTNITGTSATVNGLDACTAYEFQVMLDCGGGDQSVWSNTATLSAPVEGTPTITASAFPHICAGDPLTLTSSATSGIVWSTTETTASITPAQSGSYTVTLNGACGTYTSDPIEVVIIDPPAPPSASGVQLPAPGSTTLNATGNGVLWYDASTGGNNVGNGNSFTTPFLNSTTNYWCSSSSGDVLSIVNGGSADNTTSGQYQSNGNNWLRFTANGPFTIRSVKVYASGAGNRTIGLVDANNNVIAQGSFAVPDGESRVQLDFNVPATGEFGLRILTGDPQLWRDGLGSNPVYPYALGTYGSIIGTTVAGANTLAYYYFFYDWEVSNVGVRCESARVEVTVDVATGIEDAVTASALRAFPSPADRELVLEATGSIGRLSVIIVDGTGRQVLTRVMENGRAVIGTAPLADGLYFYRLLRNEVEVGVGRFVVEHR
ncbi:MAG TPA: hypothetical protein PK760_07380, partial [Flavobacteriales bacterium]|nr:hypothetical protein [Flavobacteriales bacterium]